MENLFNGRSVKVQEESVCGSGNIIFTKCRHCMKKHSNISFN